MTMSKHLYHWSSFTTLPSNQSVLRFNENISCDFPLKNREMDIPFPGSKHLKVMGIANQAVQTGMLSMPHPEYSYIDLASPGRLYSARENLLLPAGI
jgi:hypothetical protein